MSAAASPDRKGVNLPDSIVTLSALTEKDRADLEAGAFEGRGLAWASFIQRPEDIAEARKLTRGRAAIMSKIEKPQAISKLSEIIELSDALMVARGDLGVELPLERVPGLQKQITRGAPGGESPSWSRRNMLESMINAPVPTRAEVFRRRHRDLRRRRRHHAGRPNPLRGIIRSKRWETMNRIAQEVEQDQTYHPVIDAQRPTPEATGADAISAAARQIAETLHLPAILCLTSSGATALRVARERPEPPVVALSPNIATARRLAVLWGTHCVVMEDAPDVDTVVARACNIAFREGFAKAGQRVILVAGVPLGTPGATNMVRIAFVGGRDEEAD